MGQFTNTWDNRGSNEKSKSEKLFSVKIIQLTHLLRLSGDDKLSKENIFLHIAEVKNQYKHIA